MLLACPTNCRWIFPASHQSIDGSCPPTSMGGGNVGVTPGDLHRVAVVLQPCSWLGGAVIGLDVLVNPETFGVNCGPYCRSKATWSQVWSFPGLVDLIDPPTCIVRLRVFLLFV